MLKEKDNIDYLIDKYKKLMITSFNFIQQYCKDYNKNDLELFDHSVDFIDDIELELWSIRSCKSKITILLELKNMGVEKK